MRICNHLLLLQATKDNSRVSCIEKVFRPGFSIDIRQGFETPRRSQAYGRRPEELHIPSNAPLSQQGNREQPRHHSYHSSHDYGIAPNPGINIQQSTPQGAQYTNPPVGVALPGALQPGRPGPASVSTAPTGIPTIPQIQTSSHSQSSSRPATSNHAHSYSRSSPTGFDQSKYSPYMSTPESSKFATPSNHRYTGSQPSQGDMAFSPLGLADIRPIGEFDGSQNANPFLSDGHPNFPTNSSHTAPYPIYAFDWCKWPVEQQNLGDSAGKMAIGSYVEDGHNFVGHIK